MNARFVIARLLETFFARWWLYLLPLVALLGLGIYSAGSKADTYHSTAVLSVEDPLLEDLAPRSDAQWWESPAEAAARRVNESLRTDAFVAVVAESAGVDPAAGVLTLGEVRQGVWAAPNGRNLLTVNASTFDPELAQRLVRSTIDNYIQRVVDQQVSTGTATVEFLQRQQEAQQEELDKAAEALDTYLLTHPADGVRPSDEEVALNRLNRDVDSAVQRLNDTLDSIQQAQLVVQEATSDVTQTLREIDPPTFEPSPAVGIRDTVMTVATFGVLGMLLLVGGVVAGSLLDRSLRFAEEVRSSLGVEVLAVVPFEQRGRRRRGAVT
jgi:uncharacterized protein involved in exopolysaccharide biosynthesis